MLVRSRLFTGFLWSTCGPFSAGATSLTFSPRLCSAIIRQDACDGRFALRDDSADLESKSYCRPCREFRRDTSENCAYCNVRKNHCPPRTARTKRLHIHNRLHCSAQLPLRVRGTPEKLFFACSIPRVIDDWTALGLYAARQFRRLLFAYSTARLDFGGPRK